MFYFVVEVWVGVLIGVVVILVVVCFELVVCCCCVFGCVIGCCG